MSEDIQTKPEYEAGMRIAYEGSSRRVIVLFRGRLRVLPEAYITREEAMAAGEHYCQELGWSVEQTRATVRRPW